MALRMRWGYVALISVLPRHKFLLGRISVRTSAASCRRRETRKRQLRSRFPNERLRFALWAAAGGASHKGARANDAASRSEETVVNETIPALAAPEGTRKVQQTNAAPPREETAPIRATSQTVTAKSANGWLRVGHF